MNGSYLKFWDQAVDEKLCIQLIDKFEEDPPLPISGNRGHYAAGTFINLIDSEWGDFIEKLNPIFEDYACKYIEKFKDCLPKKYGFEAYKMKKYEANDRDMDIRHVDVWDYNTARRFVTMFLYLNDVDEGGETDFGDVAIQPRRGRIIAFPSAWNVPHQGNKPISGSKYLLGSYLHYL